ncbi:MAG: phosphotransferase family protein [Acidimicrobiales bacterium]
MNAIDPRVAPALVWVAQHVPGASVKDYCELIAGGRSNLTYRLTAADGRTWVLRRPPTGPLLPRAHDMSREYRILDALFRYTDVPVPEPIAFCDDETLLGVPFYVMADAAGTVLRHPDDAEALGPGVRSAVAGRAIEILAALHAVDVVAAGLADLGPHNGYVDRQLRRWLGQVEQSGDESAISFLGTQQRALSAAAPVAALTALVHGDYRLDNLVVDPARGSVRAVLDWEISTIGNPLADLGSLLVYWDEPGDERPALGVPGPTGIGGFPSREQLAERYMMASGTPVDTLNFYVAFGYWKLACVLHGVAHRYRSGDGGGGEAPPADADEHIRWLVSRSAGHLNGRSYA